MDALSEVNNDGGLSTSQKNLLWMTHYDGLVIHSEFKGQKRLCIESGFEAGQFHSCEFSAGRCQGKLALSR